MAVIDLDLGGLFQPNEATVDQSEINAGDVLGVNVVGSNEITITNSENLSEPLKIEQTIGVSALSTTTYNLGENAHIEMTGLVGVGVANTLEFNLSNGSTLEMSSAFLSVGLLNTVDINMGNDGTSTFVYDGTGVNLELSSFPTITGISEGDQIQVAGATQVEYRNEDLIFTNDLGVTVGRFNAPDLDPTQVRFVDGKMSYACYLKGTHIATVDGEVKVEDLQAGDKVLTASGGVATVKWIGYRTLRKARIPAEDAIRAFPITFAKGSIGHNVPHRDLTMSPYHHVSFDGKLVPAMLLVNGKTITQDFSRPVFEYFHVELEQFDILLAEGLPAESYVDTGNRSMFQNADTVALNPDFGPAEGRPEIEGIEVLRSGPVLKAIRSRLLRRAEAMTKSVRVSDPDLRVEVNGQEVRADVAEQIEGVMRFVLPAGAQASDVRVMSRSAIVRDVTAHARRDLRQVGVGLARITIEDEAGRRDIDVNDAQLSGLHTAQDVHGIAMRWTNGAATIPASLLNITGQAVLELHVLRTYAYWEQAQRAA